MFNEETSHDRQCMMCLGIGKKKQQQQMNSDILFNVDSVMWILFYDFWCLLMMPMYSGGPTQLQVSP